MSISHAVNELNKLLLVTISEEDEHQVRKLRRIYFDLFEAVIIQEIDNKTQDFKEAMTALNSARNAAKKAKRDVEKLTGAIQKAGIAAKAVDKIVNIGIKLPVS